MGSSLSKYSCNQLAEEWFPAGEKVSRRSDPTPGIGSQQLLQAACFAPNSHSPSTPLHSIHPPRRNTSASTLPFCPTFILYSLFFQLISNHRLLLLSCNFFACNFEYHCNHSIACLAFKLGFHLRLLVQSASFNTKPRLPPVSISNFLHEGSNSLSSRSFSAITSCYCFLFQHVCQVPSHCLHTRFFSTGTSVSNPKPISIILSPVCLNGPFRSLCQWENVEPTRKRISILNCTLRPNHISHPTADRRPQHPRSFL